MSPQDLPGGEVHGAAVTQDCDILSLEIAHCANFRPPEEKHGRAVIIKDMAFTGVPVNAARIAESAAAKFTSPEMSAATLGGIFITGAKTSNPSAW